MKPKIYNFRDISGATHKEIGVAEIMQNAQNRGLEAICVISSGNYITALQEEGRRQGIEVYNLVNHEPQNDHEVPMNGRILRTKKERLEAVEARGIKTTLDDYTDFTPTAYTAHADGILQDNPDYVICPIGSGKLWLSIVKRIEERNLKTKVIGITPKGKNPFHNDFEEGELDLDSIADKLPSPFTAKAEEVKSHFPRHEVIEVEERDLEKAYKKAIKTTECEPSGAAGFVYHNRRFRKEQGITKSDSVVIISTGSGLEDQVKKLKKQRRTRFINLSLGITLGAAILTGAIYYAALKTEYEKYADLNGDGKVSPCEMIEVNEIAGAFNRKDYSKDKIKREAMEALPNTPLETLRIAKKTRERMISELTEKDPSREGLESLSYRDLYELHLLDIVSENSDWEMWRAHNFHKLFGKQCE